MAKISGLPRETIQAFIDVFVKLGLRVLWKFEDETWQFPENIMIRNWLPQNGILAHKNMKLFISHGGTLGMIEGTYHGIPMLAIPVFGDHVNFYY
jgi:glucuronosyltransferase